MRVDSFNLNTPAQLSAALAALRSLDSILGKPKQNAIIAQERKWPCAICRKFFPLTAIKRIASTSVVSNVVDCFCLSCYQQNQKELDRMARIVCATCKETVMLLEPHKEPRGGFVWREGSFSHVAVCPTCKEGDLPYSPVAEKLAFYKERGIAYE